MNRRNFSTADRVAIRKRATINGVTYCEKPGCGQPCKRGDVHHLDMDAMQIDKSRKLTIQDGQFWCIPCHREATAEQVAILAQARAREASALGVRSRPVIKIKSPGFSRSERTLSKQPKTMATGNAIGRRYQEAK